MERPPATGGATRGLALAGALIALGAGCGDDAEAVSPPDASAGATLVVSFEHHVDGTPLSLGEAHDTRYGQRLAFDHIRYLVSNVYLDQGEERHEVEASYYLIEQSDADTKLAIELDDVPTGSYDGFGFHIGVDPEANDEPELGLASAAEPLTWDPEVGHTFFSARGTFEVGDDSGEFSVQTFGDPLYRRLFAELPAGLELAPGEAAAITLRADLGRLFAGIDLTRDPEIAGGDLDSTAGAVAQNYGRMVSLIAGGDSVTMSASSPNLGGGEGGEIPSDATPPELSEAPIDLEGELYCDDIPDRPPEDDRPCLTPFFLGAGDAYEDAGLLTFVTDNGGEVRAVSSGVVDEIVFQDHSMITHSDMFRIRVRAHDDAAFAVEYRWVKNFSIGEGDEIEAGEVIGEAGDYVTTERGIVSVGVVRTQERLQRMCPADFATEGLKSALEAALATSDEAWPELAFGELCSVPSLVCDGDSCEGPADFFEMHGDVDAGRRTYASSCASCHGDEGQGDVAGPLCYGPGCECSDCTDHDTLWRRIEEDMPPEGYCDPICAADAAAFIMTELRTD